VDRVQAIKSITTGIQVGVFSSVTANTVAHSPDGIIAGPNSTVVDNIVSGANKGPTRDPIKVGYDSIVRGNIARNLTAGAQAITVACPSLVSENVVTVKGGFGITLVGNGCKGVNNVAPQK
jgi:hypothetical protein